MLIRTRLTVVITVVTIFVALALSVASYQKVERELTRYHDSLLQSQHITWEKTEASFNEDLLALVDRLQKNQEWQTAVQQFDRATLYRISTEILQQKKGWRIDMYNNEQQLIFANPTEIISQPLLDANHLGRIFEQAENTLDGQLIKQAPVVFGLLQIDRKHYAWVVGQRFAQGVIAIAVDVRQGLTSIKRDLEGEVVIVNLNGHEVGATHSGILERHNISIPIRYSQVMQIETEAEQTLQIINYPLFDEKKRLMGALINVHDFTQIARGDRRFNLMIISSGLVIIVLIAALFSWYLRYLMQPLKRSVGVLDHLAHGQTDTALDENDEEQLNEAGQIARSVLALRDEMVNLQTLREERTRTRAQQERIIRNQLKNLADSLDVESRAEILKELSGDASSENADPNENEQNQLVQLASTLGRMSGLVVNQHEKLVQLVKELQEAMETKALFASLQQELAIARQMQLSILPLNAPETQLAKVAATMLPAKEVGGDFYDYFLIDEQNLAVIIADVSGKGVPAAFFMAISRTLLKSNLLLFNHPAKAIARLNDQLASENEQMMFVTCFCGVLNLTSGELNYVNAGHNPPIVFSEQKARYLSCEKNIALAVAEGFDYVEESLLLKPNDIFLLYTDGVTEAIDIDGQFFGEPRLLETMSSSRVAVHELPKHIVTCIKAFERGAKQADDITCVALQYIGQDVTE